MTGTSICRSPTETGALGEQLGSRLGPGSVIACIGELGAGKTCFVQGEVTSPTFVLVNEYRGRLAVHHLDAYRTGSLTELVDLGVEELLHGDGVTVIEWADKLGPLLPAYAITVIITGLGDEPRRIVIDDPSARAHAVLPECHRAR